MVKSRGYKLAPSWPESHIKISHDCNQLRSISYSHHILGFLNDLQETHKKCSNCMQLRNPELIGPPFFCKIHLIKDGSRFFLMVRFNYWTASTKLWQILGPRMLPEILQNLENQRQELCTLKEDNCRAACFWWGDLIDSLSGNFLPGDKIFCLGLDLENALVLEESSTARKFRVVHGLQPWPSKIFTPRNRN